MGRLIQVLFIGMLLLLVLGIPGTRAQEAAETGPTEPPEEEEKKYSAGMIVLFLAIDLILIGFCALFSGLTLAVLGLTTLNLEIIADSGKEPDKTYAAQILPIRKLGNQLLCTLVLGNVMVNTLIAQITDRIMVGWLATLVSTLLITLGGEILPLAAMAAHALYCGSKSSPIVKFFIVLFYPVCKPLGVILDLIIGSDPGQIYDRNELKKLMQLHAKEYSEESGLGAGEASFMVGALEIHEKTVVDAMTPLEDVFMLESSDVLNPDTLQLIVSKGYSHIPIHRGKRTDIVGVLLTADLLMIDPEELLSVANVMNFYHRPCQIVPVETKLVSALRFFQSGKSHIAFVQGVTDDGKRDPVYEVQGIVTPEDVLEEIIHAEIFSEAEVSGEDISASATFPGGQGKLGHRARVVAATENEKTACALFLRERVPAFAKFSMEDVLGIVSEASMMEVKPTAAARSEPFDDERNIWIYRRGVISTVFSLVVSGEVQVVTEDTEEGVAIDLPSWSVLGLDALQSQQFVPDFSCRVVQRSIILQISSALYRSKISLLEA